MDLATLLTALTIVVARIVDVSFGTLRTVSVIMGRKYVALALGFFEVLVWIFAVSAVVSNLTQPVLAVAYALGFALGNYAGITLEQRLAMGEEVIRIFTRRERAMASALRDARFPVTEFRGSDGEGDVWLLFVRLQRRRVRELLLLARRIDPQCAYVIDPIRSNSHLESPFGLFQPTGWRAIFKKK